MRNTSTSPVDDRVDESHAERPAVVSELKSLSRDSRLIMQSRKCPLTSEVNNFAVKYKVPEATLPLNLADRVRS
jgi:hypothetical protein